MGAATRRRGSPGGTSAAMPASGHSSVPPLCTCLPITVKAPVSTDFEVTSTVQRVGDEQTMEPVNDDIDCGILELLRVLSTGPGANSPRFWLTLPAAPWQTPTCPEERSRNACSSY